MNRGTVGNAVCLLCLASALLAGQPTALAAGTNATEGIPVQAGVAQLFIDDELIACSKDLKRTLHQPVKDNGGNVAMIPAKKGMTLLAYGSIVFDTQRQKYVMFVQE